jgi:hypothetical protein
LLSLLLFIVVRGLAEAEPFDLLLPLWAIILISLLSNEVRLVGSSAAIGPVHPIEFPMDRIMTIN